MNTKLVGLVITLAVAGGGQAAAIPKVEFSHMGKTVTYTCVDAAGVANYSNKMFKNCPSKVKVIQAEYPVFRFKGSRPIYQCALSTTGGTTLTYQPIAGCDLVYTGDPKGTFFGYACKSDDCAGHFAGFNWASKKLIKKSIHCPTKETSFHEGCESFAKLATANPKP